MVCKELFMTRPDGVKLYRTYSDQNLMLLQTETGIMYSEAIDPEDAERTYEETNIPIEIETSDEENIELFDDEREVEYNEEINKEI